MRRLPTFDGYVVDERLSEFRRVTYGDHPTIEFIPFSSPQGQKLLQRYYWSLVRKKG